MANPIYRVVFFNQNQVYELYVNQIYQSDLYGFIEVEEYQFNERSGMIVDPGEEKLKNESVTKREVSATRRNDQWKFNNQV